MKKQKVKTSGFFSEFGEKPERLPHSEPSLKFILGILRKNGVFLLQN